MTDVFLLISFGLITGFIGGYAGIGGAPFIIVFMTVFLGCSQHIAQGTVLAVMLGPMSLIGVLAMRNRAKKMLKFAIIGVISYGLFSYLGAYFAFLVESNNLKIIFSIFIFLIGLNEIFGILNKESSLENSNKLSSVSCSIVGSVVGVVGGFLGIGAGILMTPLFINVFSMDKDDARALSLMILLPPVSLGAVLKYSGEGTVIWSAALIIFISYFLTNYFGSKLALTHSASRFKRNYGYILVFISIANFIPILINS